MQQCTNLAVKCQKQQPGVMAMKLVKEHQAMLKHLSDIQKQRVPLPELDIYHTRSRHLNFLLPPLIHASQNDHHSKEYD